MVAVDQGTREHQRRVFSPRGGCLDVISAREPEVLLAGPAGTGKSRACLEKVHHACVGTPGTRALLVRKTAVSLTTSALVTWEEQVVKEPMDAGTLTFFGGNAKEPAQYRYSNGSTVAIGGMDRPTKVMSTEYDLIYVQEAIELTPDDWEALSSRLRHGRLSFQQLLADTNPSADTHWLYQRCVTGSCRLIASHHEDNPILYDDAGQLTVRGAAYMARLERLTGVRKARLRYGRWVAAEGQIFETFERTTHVVPRFPIPAEWVRWWAVDFGFTNPFVLQCWAEDPDGRLYLYRELYRTRRLVEDHAKDILAIVRPDGRAWLEPRPRAIICDHDAEDRATLQRHLGLSTTAARKAVTPGLQAVQTRFTAQADGRPRLYLFDDALVERDQDLADALLPTCTADEIPGYVWEPPTAGRAPKEQPHKEHDHGCDAMRYMVAQRDLGGRSRVRWM
jgi:phage terminase large subunit